MSIFHTNVSIWIFQAILDLFRKMFMDSHTKVYALFLDSVNELIMFHADNLHDWLFVLLTRLFNKLGAELLGSMHSKIWKTLTLVHESFPSELQLTAVFRWVGRRLRLSRLKARENHSKKWKLVQLQNIGWSCANAECQNKDFRIEIRHESGNDILSQWRFPQACVDQQSSAEDCTDGQRPKECWAP